MDKVSQRIASGRAEIDSLPLPVETKTYKPVAFGHVAEALDDAMEEHHGELNALGYTDTTADLPPATRPDRHSRRRSNLQRQDLAHRVWTRGGCEGLLQWYGQHDVAVRVSQTPYQVPPS